MKGRNIKIKGHSLKRVDPNGPHYPYRWECHCGAWGTVFGSTSDKARSAQRRDAHDDHKIEVLRSQGKWEEEENA